MTVNYTGLISLRWFVVVVVLMESARAHGSVLGEQCRQSEECSVAHARCDRGFCTCQPFYAQANATTCLESTLLGSECVVSEQCSLKVAYSACLEGVCRCTDGHLQFRKHTCLSPAPPGHVCYSNEHCRLWDKESHCEYVIPNLFGRCGCNTNFRQIGETCVLVKPIFPTEVITPEDEAVIVDATSGSPPDGITTMHHPKPPNNLNPGSEDPFAPPNEVIDSDEMKPSSSPLSSSNNEVLSSEDSGPLTQAVKGPLADPAKAPISNRKNGEASYTVNGSQIVANLHANDQPVYRVVTQPSTDKKSNKKTASKVVGKPYKTGHVKKYPSKDKHRIRNDVVEVQDLSPASLGMSCVTDSQCQIVDPHTRCANKRCDCAYRTNSTSACSARNRGCLPGTFQCRSTGACISWYFVCDGRKDCPDGSDEKCEGIGKDGSGERCPMHAFRCGGAGGRCVSRAARCDGKQQCPGGEDERNCQATRRKGCPRHTFRCGSGECLPEYEFCNAVVSCKDASDEPSHLCNEQSRWRAADFCPLRCGNGRCRSTAVACSGRDGCGDNSDEIACTVCRCPAPPDTQLNQHELLL